MSCSKKPSPVKRVLISWLIVAAAFFAFGFIVGALAKEPETPKPVVTATEEPTKLTSLGEYRLTAYCGCAECCGQWGEDRPVDENDNQIVYTASQEIAQEGVTIAADTDILPFGTEVIINGHPYIVQDRGGAIEGKTIDIYFDTHQAAREFGIQHAEVFMKDGSGETF